MLSYSERLALAEQEAKEFRRVSIRARLYEYTEYKKLKPYLQNEDSSCLF